VHPDLLVWNRMVVISLFFFFFLTLGKYVLGCAEGRRKDENHCKLELPSEEPESAVEDTENLG